MGTAGDHRDRPAYKPVERQICQHCRGLGWIPVSGLPVARLTESERVQELVAWLDRADVPVEWGRLRISRLLREAGIKCRTQVVSSAAQIRWERAWGYPKRGRKDV